MDQYITHHRFDLIAKYLYLKYQNQKFYQDLYSEHIITFNNTWEFPGTKKNINEFKNSFNKLNNLIKKDGFNNKYPIEIGKNGVIINGAHRLMICFYNNIQPKFKISNKNGCETYHYDFFLNRNKYWKREKIEYQNLKAVYADTMAIEYLNLKLNLRPLIFYPICYTNFEINYDKIKNIFDKYGSIYYYKKIKYNKIQLKNFIKELYRGESWIGGLFPNNNCGGKLDPCYSENYTQLYLFKFNNLNHMVKMKKELRIILKLEKNSLHIPDTSKESFRISSGFLNKNNESFYNYDLNLEQQENLTQVFKQKNSEDFCWDLENNILVTDKNIINHPNNYFYINGYKIKNFL